MLAVRLEHHQIDHIDDANFQLWEMLAQKIDGGQRLHGGDISGAGHDDIWLPALVVAGPFPNADACGAMFDGGIHVQPLQGWLFPGNDDVDIVTAAQAVVRHRQQRVRIRGQIDANDLGLFVDDMIDEARVLVAEAIVVLPPDMRRQQIIERADGPTPRDLADVFSHLAC